MDQWQWVWDNILPWLAIAVLVAWGKTHTRVVKLHSELKALREDVAENRDAISAQDVSSAAGVNKLNNEIQQDLKRMQEDIEYLRRNSINGQELERYLIHLNSIVSGTVSRMENMRKGE